MSQLPFGWVCFSNGTRSAASRRRLPVSRLPFGWVCFSNARPSADSFLLDFLQTSQLPFGWVCFSNPPPTPVLPVPNVPGLNCLSAGSVSLTIITKTKRRVTAGGLNCLSAGSVSLTAMPKPRGFCSACPQVSIAFRLGLFL